MLFLHRHITKWPWMWALSAKPVFDARRIAARSDKLAGICLAAIAVPIIDDLGKAGLI